MAQDASSDHAWPWVFESPTIPNIATDWPKITIITPSFNQGEFIEETILSVINQNYPNLEFIIMDGGSTDSSVKIIKKYAGQINYWESKPDKGQTHALNKGLARASGDIIGYLNSDDCYMPGALLKVGEAYAKNWSASNQKLVFTGDAFSGSTLSGTPNKTITRGMYLAKPMNMVHGYGICAQPATFWTKNAIPFDESLQFVMDFDYWVKLSFNQYIPIDVNHTIAFMREHSEAKSTRLSELMWLELAYLPFKHSLYFDDIHQKLWAIQASRYKLTAYLRLVLLRNRETKTPKEHLKTILYTYKQFPYLWFSWNFLKFNLKTLYRRT